MVKANMKEVVESQPDYATYEAILRELAFERMVDRGFTNSRKGQVTSNEQMKRRVRMRQRYDEQMSISRNSMLRFRAQKRHGGSHLK